MSYETTNEMILETEVRDLKARIAELEAENADLRYELVKTANDLVEATKLLAAAESARTKGAPDA